MFGAVQIAFAKGSLVVAAAGNEFAQGNPVIFPAAYPHVLSVAVAGPVAAVVGLQQRERRGRRRGARRERAGRDAGRVRHRRRRGRRRDARQRDELRGADRLRRRGLAGDRAPRPLQRPARRRAAPLGARRRRPPATTATRASGSSTSPPRSRCRRPPATSSSPTTASPSSTAIGFAKPDPYVWRGSGRRTLGGSADRVEDPFDVYRIRLPPRSSARIRVRPAFGDPDLFVFRSSAPSIDDDATSSPVRARAR